MYSRVSSHSATILWPSRCGDRQTVTRHDEVVRESFTTQAATFAANPWITNEERIGRLVAAAQLKGNERVLDVACGPGYIAEAFARAAREAIGVDLTAAMVAIAEERTKKRGVSNVSFRIGDVQHLPFGDEEFDVVVCRLALHHMPEPERVVKEMARVCRVEGIVLVEDIYGSEHAERAAYQDHWEKLRDPSHVRTLPLSEHLRLFREAGLETDRVLTFQDLCPEVERWLATTKTPAEDAVEVRRLLEEDGQRDLSGTRPFQDATGKLHFHARTVILTGRKFRVLA
jgi:SAM-dependent methyltransferase